MGELQNGLNGESSLSIVGLSEVEQTNDKIFTRKSEYLSLGLWIYQLINLKLVTITLIACTVSTELFYLHKVINSVKECMDLYLSPFEIGNVLEMTCIKIIIIPSDMQLYMFYYMHDVSIPLFKYCPQSYHILNLSR